MGHQQPTGEHLGQIRRQGVEVRRPDKVAGRHPVDVAGIDVAMRVDQRGERVLDAPVRGHQHHANFHGPILGS